MINVLCVVSYHFLPPKFGGQKAIALFYKYFGGHVRLTCITTGNNDPATAQGYTVLNILSNSPLRYINIFYFFTLRKQLRQNRHTHLLLEHPYYAWLGVLLKRFTGVQLIIRSHNIEGLRWRSLGKWWWKGLWYYEKWAHRKADHNFFIQERDRQYAIEQYGVSPERCLLVTYGIEWDQPPALAARTAARSTLLQQHDIPAHHHLLLFNGAFDYLPNLNGLKNIIDHINPLLQQQDFPYTILICGRHIPEEISRQTLPNIVVAGFVDDIDLYFKGAAIFMNPVTEGGGIKTKLVEALGTDMNAVSTRSGAEGIDPALCNGKLVLTDDNNWKAFTQAIVQAASHQASIPATFFEHFYWGNIARQAATAIVNREL